jgi:hypothetical protein
MIYESMRRTGGKRPLRIAIALGVAVAGVVSCGDQSSHEERAFMLAIDAVVEDLGRRATSSGGELFVDPRPVTQPLQSLPESYAPADADMHGSLESAARRRGLARASAIFASQCWFAPGVRWAPAYPGSESLTDDHFREYEERCAGVDWSGTYLVVSIPEDNRGDGERVASRLTVHGYSPGCRRSWEIEVDRSGRRARVLRGDEICS